MGNPSLSCPLVLVGSLLSSLPVAAQGPEPTPGPVAVGEARPSRWESLDVRLDALEKQIDDARWKDRVGDLAWIDKISICGPPPAKVANPADPGAKNPLVFPAYVFLPKDLDLSKKHPLMLFPHGGVQSNFSTYYARAVRHLVGQGYIVAAPEYRGSTGYGKELAEALDYGGLEVDDVHALRQHMVENCPLVDRTRVGVFGWSHGGMIALLCLTRFPQDYRAAYAGQPVSELTTRLGYSTEQYRKIFSAPGHIGKTPREDPAAYRARSPLWQVGHLEAPVLIHAATNDDDVRIIEAELLIHALKAAGKKFEYEIFQDIPGGHSFDRLDTRRSREIQLKIYQFLARELRPEKPFRELAQLDDPGWR